LNENGALNKSFAFSFFWGIEMLGDLTYSMALLKTQLTAKSWWIRR
jgi:hypothetical protein